MERRKGLDRLSAWGGRMVGWMGPSPPGPPHVQSRHSDSAKKTTSPSMLLSPDRPSLAAALVGTTAGEVVAVPVPVAVADAPVAATEDVLVTTVVVDEGGDVLVTTVVPESTTEVSLRVQGTVVETELADVEGSENEAELPLWIVVVVVTGSFAAARVAALRAARRTEQRILAGGGRDEGCRFVVDGCWLADFRGSVDWTAQGFLDRVSGLALGVCVVDRSRFCRYD